MLPCIEGRGNRAALSMVWIVFAHFMIITSPGGETRTSPRHVFLVQSKVNFEYGARLDCLIIPKYANVKHTLMAGPNSPRLEHSEHIFFKMCGVMGNMRLGVERIVRSAARNMVYNGKPSRDGGSRASCLCINRIPLI